MNQATEAVCWADSDDEDYIDFSAQELETGIANLYDEDSASDYNDDVEEDEESVDLSANEIQRIVQQPLQEEDDHDDDDDDQEDLFYAAPPQQQQQQQQQQVPYPTPVDEARQEKVGLFSQMRSSFRSLKSMAPTSNSSSRSRSSSIGKKKRVRKQKEKEKINNNNNNNNNSNRKRKSKVSQLNKRIHRLRNAQHEHKLRSKQKKVVHRQKVNNNIISVDLGTLKEAADNISTGDAFVCAHCGAILSKHDELLKKYEDIKLDDEDESIWVCKFCNYVNIIEIDEEEIPKAETVDYILAPAPTDDQKSNTKDASTKDKEAESQIIFCIDTSGSMCVSQQIDLKNHNFKLKGSHLNKEHEDLSAFIDANAGHLNQMQNQQQYVSRMQCVQTAVDDQIEKIAKKNPNKKVGIVTFASDVTIIGDGTSTHEVVAGGKLSNVEKLREIASAKCASLLGKTVGEAKEQLSNSLWKLQESGQTALGPGLVVAIEMASTQPGSQVILCTDGLANVGVGSLEMQSSGMDEEAVDAQEQAVSSWYERLGEYAMSKGVIVSIISITDDGCRLENLGKIVELTNGNLKRINPLNLTEKFAGIIENESIATNAQAKMLLHPGLKFHSTVNSAVVDKDQDDDDDDDDDEEQTKGQKNKKSDNESESKEKEEASATGVVSGDVDPKMAEVNKGRTIYKIAESVQDCGNVFEGSRIFFEYVINKERKQEFKDLKSLPFQTQIEYQKKDGSRMMRVISQTKAITYDKQRIRKNLNFDILAKHGTHVTTELAAKGDYESSRAWTAANTMYLNNNAVHQKQLLTLANYAQQNVALDHQMHQQMQTESIDMLSAPGLPGAAPMPSSVAADSLFAFGGSSSKSKKSKKKKMASRKNARNDQFSSYIFNMKKKSHK